jgi:gliding motility-associated-like protein
VKMSITQTPTVLAGPNQSICATTGSIALNGGVFGGTGSGVMWTTSGSGVFNPSSGQVNTQYYISAGDVSAGVVTFTLISLNNGPCPAGSASMSLQVTPLATVNAGPNQYLCSNAGSVTLNGTINGVGTGTWSSSGTGAFSPGISSLNPSVAFTSADISSGSVTFTLTSTNNGVCPAISDSVKITIATIATVNAGPNQTICSSTPTVNLNGSVGGVTSAGFWATGGSGAFNPSFTSLNTTYFVSVQDLAAGGINFTLTSSGNGPCPAVTDTMKIAIVPIAAVNAGPNQYVCSNTPTISLAGIVNSNTNGGSWSGSGGGTFIPGNTALNATYSMTSSDASNGSVTFTLTATGNAPCPAVTDTVKIKIKIPAQVNAGPDLIMCSSSPAIALGGTVSAGSSTGIWNTFGTGNFSPANTALNATYNASSADINNGTVYLVLTSTNNDVCPAASDTTKLTIIKKPTINLKNDTIICSYQNPLKIVANVTGGSGSYVWSTSGSGTFTFAGGLNAVYYTMSAADIAAGFVKLTITSVFNGPCGDLSANINVIINPAPIADFTPSTYTANIPNDPVQFTNQSTGANSYYWIFGDGGFTNLVNPIHNYVTVGYYTVSLIATNQYGCKDTTDKVIKVISDIQFPNVFTPNLNGSNGGSYNPNDYSNDVFFPYTSGVTDYHLRIFNRWGELIFESQDINVGWDGYFNGKLCQQDAYVWKADVKFFDGRKYNKTGNVTLLR